MKNEFLKKLYNLLQNKYNKWARDNAAQSYQLRWYCISKIMYAMTYDLFQALGNRNYSLLNSIKTPADIRLYDYIDQNGTFFYRFTVSKQQTSRIASTILQAMQANMNKDIKQAQYRTACYYGNEYLSVVHPFLFGGMYIMGIADFGTDICLTIASNIQP